MTIHSCAFKHVSLLAGSVTNVYAVVACEAPKINFAGPGIPQSVNYCIFGQVVLEIECQGFCPYYLNFHGMS